MNSWPSALRRNCASSARTTVSALGNMSAGKLDNWPFNAQRLLCINTVELGYNVVKGTEYFVSL
jgi:hypothetical protein